MSETFHYPTYYWFLTGLFARSRVSPSSGNNATHGLEITQRSALVLILISIRGKKDFPIRKSRWFGKGIEFLLPYMPILDSVLVLSPPLRNGRAVSIQGPLNNEILIPIDVVLTRLQPSPIRLTINQRLF